MKPDPKYLFHKEQLDIRQTMVCAFIALLLAVGGYFLVIDYFPSSAIVAQVAGLPYWWAFMLSFGCGGIALVSSVTLPITIWRAAHSFFGHKPNSPRLARFMSMVHLVCLATAAGFVWLGVELAEAIIARQTALTSFTHPDQVFLRELSTLVQTLLVQAPAFVLFVLLVLSLRLPGWGPTIGYYLYRTAQARARPADEQQGSE